MTDLEHSRFWGAWSGFVVRRPGLVVILSLTVSVLFGAVAVTTPRDMTLTGLLGADDPEVERFTEMDREFGSSSLIVLLLEGEAADVESATAAIVEGLHERVPNVIVNAPPDPQWLIDRGPWLWPGPLFESVTRAVETGTEPPALVTQLALVDEFIRARVKPVETAAILTFEFGSGSLDMMSQGLTLMAAVPIVESILEEHGYPGSAEYTGASYVGMESGGALLKRLGMITPFTLIAVMLLLLAIEPRISRTLVAGIALSCSVAIALGFVGIVNGRLSPMSTLFAMILLGLGVDFAVHLLVGLRDAGASGLCPEGAVRQAIDHTASPIVLGGLSTALAFVILLAIPDQGAKDVGMTAVAGLLSALILMLSFLPAAWLLLERRRAHDDQPARINLPGLRAVVRMSMKYPRTILIIGVFLGIAGLAGIPRYELESDFKKLITRDVESLKVLGRLEDLFGTAMTPYIAPVESLEQAREWSAELRKLPGVKQATSIADLLGEEDESRAARMTAALSAKAAKAGGQLRDRLAAALEVGPAAVEDVPRQFSKGVVGKNGQLAIRVVPRNDIMDAREIGAFLAELRTVAPTTTGFAAISRIAIVGRRDFVPVIVPAIFVAVWIVLILAFRNWRDVMFALLPVSVGTAITFGTCFWFGLQFDRLTGFVVPVILGLGVDDGIHVVERLRRYRVRTEKNIHAAVEGVGRPIFLTTATTTVSFASLLFTNHYPFEALARFMLIGVPVCFLTSIMMVPGAALIVERRKERADLETARRIS